MRSIAAYILAPYLAQQQARFGKHHRHEETITYRLVDTILANRLADAINPMATTSF